MQTIKKQIIKILCLILSLCLFFVAGCKTADEVGGAEPVNRDPDESVDNVTTAEKIVTMANTSPWTASNPFISMDGNTKYIHYLIWEPLFMTSIEGELVPGVAESYEVNEEMTEFVIYIRQNAFFSDGEQLTADDVVFTFNLGTNSDLASSQHNYFRMITGTDDESGVALEGESLGVEKVDDFTVKLTAKEPVDAFTFLANLRVISILPEHVLKEIPIAELEYYDFFNKVPGYGQLIYKSEIPGERMELAVNKSYARGTIDFDKLIIKIIPSTNLLSAFMAGEVDVCYVTASSPLPLVDYETAKGQTGFSVIEVPNLSFSEMAIDNQDEDLSDVRVRQALCYAIDREALAQYIYEGLADVCYGPYAPNHPYFNSSYEYRGYDPEKAIALLKEAGWDENRVLKFAVPSSNEDRQKMAIIIQQYLEAVGVKTEIYPLDNATLFSSMVGGEYQLGMFGSGGAIETSNFSVCMTEGSSVNFSRIVDPRYAELFLAAEKELTPDEKKVHLNALQELIDEECPYVFLTSPMHLAPLSDRITGVNYSDITMFLCDMTQWSVTN